jgi:hypothetical protein
MAASINASWIRRAPLVGGAVLLPLGILAAYLVLSRWPKSWFNDASDLFALGIATAAGGLCVWSLIGRARWLLIAVAVYFLACAFSLLAFSFSFLCAVFEECL